MSEKPLLEFDLDCDLSVTWRQFWRSEKFYLEFLREQKDLDIVLGKWEDGGTADTLTRAVECSHPVKVSFPGTPSHTRCFRQQKMKLSNKNSTLTLTENMRFEGIPYSDYFTVETVWHINERVSRNTHDAEIGDISGMCSVKIYTKVEFLKWSMLKGTISSNTESEAREGLQLWHTLASNSLLKSLPKRTQMCNSGSNDQIAKWFSVASLSPRNSVQSLQSMADLAKGELSRQSSVESFGGSGNDSGGGGGGGDNDFNEFSEAMDWDSDSEFFDVEFSKESDTGFPSLASPRPSFQRVSSFRSEASDGSSGSSSTIDDSTFKVLRGALVVVIQFAWWRIRSASIDTWGPLFAPNPSTVARRLVKSLIPITFRGVDCDCSSGSGEGNGVKPTTSLAILTSNPDLFVPVMLVLSLAQVRDTAFANANK
jgi:hypothetical protein